MTRDLGLDDARDRQMHDTFDPDPARLTREQLDTAHAAALDAADEVLHPATPRKRDWHNVGTRVRTARLSDELWNAVKAEADRTDSTTSTIVRDALDAYLDRRP